MTLCDLVQSLRWPDVKASLLWSYADAAQSLGSYRLVWTKLRSLAPVQSNMRIIVKETFQEALDDEPAVHVVGRNGELNRDQSDFHHLSNSVDSEWGNSETEFLLSFRPWKEWLGMRIDDHTMSEFTPDQIVAHCLWDMTFHGFEEWEIQEEWEEIKRVRTMGKALRASQSPTFRRTASGFWRRAGKYSCRTPNSRGSSAPV